MAPSRSLTQNKEGSGKSGKTIPEIPEIPEPRGVSVDDDDTIVSDTMTPRHHGDRPTDKPLAWSTVSGKDGRKVVVSVREVDDETDITR
jgi:hypothetical protein